MDLNNIKFVIREAKLFIRRLLNY